MTDERMDARLRAAGEAWRTATASSQTTSVAEPITTPAPGGPHRSRRVALLASAAVVAAALAAGGGYVLSGTGGDRGVSADTAPLQGTVWRLIAYGDEQRRPDSSATLYVSKDGTLIADDACTLVGAHVRVNDHRLDVTHIEPRYYGCVDAGGELTFDRGLSALASNPTYSIDGAGLTISAPGKPVMHLAAADHLVPPTLDFPTLQGATWLLTKVTDGAGTNHKVHGMPTLTIDGDRLETSDGCNSISGSVDVAGQQLTLSSVVTTSMNCADTTTSSVIDRFFAAHTLHQQTDGTTLTIKGQGIGELVYGWVPKDKHAVDPQRFTGPTWQLTSVAGERATGDVSLHVDADGTVSGNDGCAALHGTAQIAHGSYTTSSLPEAPPSSCGQPARDQATTVDSFLHTGGLWAIRDGKLLLYGGGAQAFSLLFEPAKTTALVGRRWALTSISTESGNSGGGQGFGESDVTLAFAADGSVRLDGECGPYAGRVTLKSDDAVFSAMHGPGSSCAGRSAEGRVVKVLTGTVGWSVGAGRLDLTKDGTTVTFEDRSGPMRAELVGTTWTAWFVTISSARSVDDADLPAYKIAINDAGTSMRVTDPDGRHQDLPITVTDGTIVFRGTITPPAGACRAETELVGLFHGRQPWSFNGGILFIGDQNGTNAAFVDDENFGKDGAPSC